MKKAFTLTEMLLALVIVGVISVLILPSLNINIKNRINSSKYKKAVTVLTNGTKQMQALYQTDRIDKLPIYYECDAMTENSAESRACFHKEYSKVMKIAKSSVDQDFYNEYCDVDGASRCGKYTAMLDDGTIFTVDFLYEIDFNTRTNENSIVAPTVSFAEQLIESILGQKAYAGASSNAQDGILFMNSLTKSPALSYGINLAGIDGTPVLGQNLFVLNIPNEGNTTIRIAKAPGYREFPLDVTSHCTGPNSVVGSMDVKLQVGANVGDNISFSVGGNKTVECGRYSDAGISTQSMGSLGTYNAIKDRLNHTIQNLENDMATE